MLLGWNLTHPFLPLVILPERLCRVQLWLTSSLTPTVPPLPPSARPLALAMLPSSRPDLDPPQSSSQSESLPPTSLGRAVNLSSWVLCIFPDYNYFLPYKLGERRLSLLHLILTGSVPGNALSNITGTANNEQRAQLSRGEQSLRPRRNEPQIQHP